MKHGQKLKKECNSDVARLMIYCQSGFYCLVNRGIGRLSGAMVALYSL